MTRRDELAAGLASVRDRVARACSESGRDPDEIELVAVTKFFPASDADLLAELGVRHVEENRHQEAVEKVAELRHRDRSRSCRRPRSRTTTASRLSSS